MGDGSRELGKREGQIHANKCDKVQFKSPSRKTLSPELLDLLKRHSIILSQSDLIFVMSKPRIW